MDRKKVLIFVFAGTSLLFLFLFLVVLDGAGRERGEAMRLLEEKTSISAELDNVRNLQKGLNDKIASLNEHIEGLNGEKDSLQAQLAEASRERDGRGTEVNRLRGELEKALAALEQSRKAPPVQEPPAPVQVPPVEFQSSSANEYWAAVLKEKANLEIRLEDLSRQFSEAKVAADRLQREKGEIEQEIASLKNENQDLKRELEYNKKMMDSLTLELAMEKNMGYEVKSSVDFLKDENKNLKERLKALGEEKETLEMGLAELKAANSQLESSLEKMQVFVKEKMQQMDTLKTEFSRMRPPDPRPSGEEMPGRGGTARGETIDLPPIVIRPEGAQKGVVPRAESAAQVEKIRKAAASIVAVNKDNNFVIINQGSGQGVKQGDSLRVFDKDNKPAGEVEVIQVRDNISAADIKKEIRPLGIGFSVR